MDLPNWLLIPLCALAGCIGAIAGILGLALTMAAGNADRQVGL